MKLPKLILLCLALGGVALTLLQPLAAKGQDQFFNNKDGRVTFLVDAKIDGGNYLGERTPVKLGGKMAQLDISSFKLNGQLWGLVGELVEVYYAKYTLGDRLRIPVSADNLNYLDQMPNGAGGVAYVEIRRKLGGNQQVELTESETIIHVLETNQQKQKHLELAVSSDLFDQIAISSQFHMDIAFGRGNLGGCTVSRNYPGILGKAGAWGWDVPGSPAWDQAFAGRNHDQATNYWQILKTETHTVDAKVSDLSIYLGNFMAALHAANPEAADKLSAAMSGYPRNVLTDQAETGLAALQEAGQNVAKELAAGNLTEATRTAAAQAAAQALNGSPKMKAMAERLNGVLKLAVPAHPAIDALLKQGDFAVSYQGFYDQGSYQLALKIRRNPNSQEVEFCIPACSYKPFDDENPQTDWIGLKSLIKVEPSGRSLTFYFRDDVLHGKYYLNTQNNPHWITEDNKSLIYLVGWCRDEDSSASKVVEWVGNTAKLFQTAIKELHPEKN